MSAPLPPFVRPHAAELARRLREPRRFIQVVAGPRQSGKTTLVRQVTSAVGRPVRFVTADEPTLRHASWIAQQWESARLDTTGAGRRGAVLVIDEVQKAPGWAETVKRLWDEDTGAGRRLKVVLLGSSPLLVQQGLTESLAGRFELIRLPHWSYAEMHEAFGWRVDQFVIHGGYPGAAPLATRPARWRRYILDSLVETTIARDVLLLTRVDKPALLRRLFELGCRYSGQVLSYTKMLGQLQDAGNTTTLAHYLDLLAGAGMLAGIPEVQRFPGPPARFEPEAPGAQHRADDRGRGHPVGPPPQRPGDPRPAHRVGGRRSPRQRRGGGRLRAVLLARPEPRGDFIVRNSRRLVAIEVKSGRARDSLPGMDAFAAAYAPDRMLLVGAEGIPLESFLARPVTDWLRG